MTGIFNILSRFELQQISNGWLVKERINYDLIQTVTITTYFKEVMQAMEYIKKQPRIKETKKQLKILKEEK